MKTIIIYASKTGTTKRCAALLAANLGAENCDLFDINSGEPDLSLYDCAAVGSYLRMGVMDKKISAFLKKRRDELFAMPFGIFLCGCLEDAVSEAIVKNISDDFLERAVSVDFFGGEMHPEKYKGFDKMVFKSISKISEKDPTFKFLNAIIPENITAFAAELSGAAEK